MRAPNPIASAAVLLVVMSLAGLGGPAQGSPQTQPSPTSGPASGPTTAASAPTTAPSAPTTAATAPTTAASAPATAPAPPPVPVLHLHVGAMADESMGQPKPQLSGPPAQIIRLLLPPQIVGQWAGALPQDTEVMLRNVAFDLHPTADGVFRIDQGVMGFHSLKPNEVRGYEIEFQNTMATVPNPEARHYAGLVTVSILPDRKYVFALEATIKVTPAKFSGSMDAVDAEVVWTGPLPSPAPATQPAK